MDEVKTVLVTGASGGVGRTVCRVFRDHAFRVRGLVRPEDDPTAVPPGLDDLTVGYVQDRATVSAALRGADAVVHCAALLPNALHRVRPEAFREVNVGGTVNVLERAIRQHTSRAVFFSTISVVDHVTRRIGREHLFDYLPGPHDAYLASKIEAEKALRRMGPDYDGHLALLRPAFIYGPDNYAVWDDALRLVRAGKMTLIGDGRARLPLIYAEDIARYLIALLTRRPPGPGLDLHVLSSREPTTIGHIFDLIADRLGARRPRRVPLWTVRLGAWLASFLPEKLRVGRLKLLTPARVRQYSRGYDLSGVLDHPLLDQVPMTSYRVGIVRMIEDYLGRQRGGRAA